MDMRWKEGALEPILREALSTAPTLMKSTAGRNILIADHDLFGNVGGGQSVYRSVIAGNPRDTYYYFREHEAIGATRPANAIPVDLHEFFDRKKARVPTGMQLFFRKYVDALNMAASLADRFGRMSLDVVDTPDYRYTGLFLRHALQSEGISVDVVALALHGTISAAVRHGWPTGRDESRLLAELRVLESLQFRAADARYAISPAYAARLQRNAMLPINIVDPLCIVGGSEPTPAAAGDHKPDLVFVGRREKWKGPDLFLDMAWWVGPEKFRRLLLVGPDGPNHLGVGSGAALSTIIANRGLAPAWIDRASREELHQLFGMRTLLLLPSRHDTFNLVALEALRQGCPVLMSRHAGISTWLKKRLPELEWLIVDVGCHREAAGAARTILSNYDDCRSALLDALTCSPLVPDPSSLRNMYLPAGRKDDKACEALMDIASAIDTLSPPRELAAHARMYDRGLRKPVRPRLRRQVTGLLFLPAKTVWQVTAKAAEPIMSSVQGVRNSCKLTLRHFRPEHVANQRLGISPRTLQQVRSARNLRRFHRRVTREPERSTIELEAKLRFIGKETHSFLIDRVRTYREMVRLERKRNHNELIAATYCLRLMRWLGNDAYGDLPFIMRILRAHGYPAEAQVAHAMFADPASARERSLALMEMQRTRHLSKPDLPLRICDDRRGNRPVRAAVIVSMYRAESKLRSFLSMLAQDALAQRGELEIILVDSGSPSSEYVVFQDFVREHPLPILYARSAARETIQAAWNRGIRLSRAPYMTCLGVDEGIHPDCLATLAGVLDSEESVDWVMADSIVTNVDRSGVFDSDVMVYDRRGYRQELVYLDTCYLSWVGGLYRRSIHDRFGYYDETFRAAGDTEFKCRVMPFIESRHVPRLLGVFNNYPEERTTQHPRAEIEDLRAWYLWRSEAGMQYAFAGSPVERVVELFRDCLRYRKSFCKHWSTDFDLAASVARHLARRPDAPSFASLAIREMETMLDLFRSFELLARRGKRKQQIFVASRLYKVKSFESAHQRLFGLDQKPHYEIFNDNRYEQHWWSWSK